MSPTEHKEITQIAMEMYLTKLVDKLLIILQFSNLYVKAIWCNNKPLEKKLNEHPIIKIRKETAVKPSTKRPEPLAVWSEVSHITMKADPTTKQS